VSSELKQNAFIGEQGLVDFNEAVKLRDLENPLLGARFLAITLMQDCRPSYSKFCVKIPKFSLPWQRWSAFSKFKWRR